MGASPDPRGDRSRRIAIVSRLSVSFYLAAGLAAALVGFDKSGMPAMGMLGVPILALTVSPVAAAAILLPIYIVSDVFGLILYRRNFSGRNLAILVPAAIAGVGVGWATASFISEAAVTLLVGSIGLVYCANLVVTRRLTRPARRADVSRGVLWGGLTGFTSFVSHSGAPPFQMYVLPQRLEKMAFLGTGTILFAVVNLAKLGPYYALGQLSNDNLAAAAWVVPVALAAIWIGSRLVRVIPERTFYLIVEVALLAVSLKLVYDGGHALLS